MSEDSQLAETSTAAATATQEGCPTPLAWQQVVQAIRQEGVRHRVEVNGITTSAISLGEGPPLYLLPGFLGNHELYALTAWLLREKFKCVLVDPPGIPAGKDKSAVTVLERWTDSILTLSETLGHERLRVYASSFGGLFALRMLTAHAERLHSVALHSAFARMRLSFAERGLVAVGMRSRRTVGQLQTVMRIQQQNHRHWFPPFDPTRWDFYAGTIAATPVVDTSLRALVAGQIDLREELPQATTPTLLIQSEGDGRAALAAQNELMERWPGAHVEALDNSGRLPHITHPHRLVKLLRSFWEQTL